jgi:MFS family permease
VAVPSKSSSPYTGRAAVGRIDFLGAALGAATICLLLGLTWGSNATYPWSSPQVSGILVAAAILFGAFLVAERKASEPIVPLDLFRNRVFTVAVLLSLLQLMVLGGLIVYLPLFFQGVLGVSATSAGAVLTPLSLSSVIGAVLASSVMAVLKGYRVITILSALIMTVGVFLLTRMTPTTGLLEAIIFMVIVGIGLGPFYTVPTVAAQNALPRTRLGIGTSTLRYLGQLGLVLGVAIIGTVVNNTLALRLAKIPGIGFLPAPVVKLATNPQALLNDTYRQSLIHSVLQHTPPQLQQNVLHLFNQVFDALKHSLAVAIIAGFAVALVMCAMTVLSSLLLKDLPSNQTPDGAATNGEVGEVPLKQ